MPGYLEEFVQFWSANADTRQIWVSLYTPQIGETAPEILTPADRELVVQDLLRLRTMYPKLKMPKGMIEVYRKPPASPEACVFAQTTTTPVRRPGAPHHALPVRRQPRLRAVRVHRQRRARGGRPPQAPGRHPGRGHLLVVAAGREVGRPGPRRRGRVAADRPDAGRTEGLSRPLLQRRLGRGRETGLLYSTGRARTRSAHQSRPASRPRHPQSAGGAEVRVRADQHRAPAAGAHHPDPPLQHRLRLLQRVRQGQPAGADRGHARADRPPRDAEAARSWPSAAASRCSTPTSTC